MLPERAVDTAPRGRVSGVFGCEEDSFELGNIGAASSPDVGGRRPRPRPASRSAGQWARGAGRGDPDRDRAGGEPGPEQAPAGPKCPFCPRLRFVFRASLAGWAIVAEISWHGFVRFYGFTD